MAFTRECSYKCTGIKFSSACLKILFYRRTLLALHCVHVHVELKGNRLSWFNWHTQNPVVPSKLLDIWHVYDYMALHVRSLASSNFKRQVLLLDCARLKRTSQVKNRKLEYFNLAIKRFASATKEDLEGIMMPCQALCVPEYKQDVGCNQPPSEAMYSHKHE